MPECKVCAIRLPSLNVVTEDGAELLCSPCVLWAGMAGAPIKPAAGFGNCPEKRAILRHPLPECS